MTDRNAAAVVAVANEWVWIPDGAPHVRTDDVLLIRYPDWFATPTTARGLRAVDDPSTLVERAHAVVRGWGREHIWWVVSDLSGPAALEAELLRRGAEVTERTDILALPLGGRLPDLGVPSEVEVVEVTDEQTMRDALSVEADAFGRGPAGDEQLADALAEMRQTARDRSGGRFVAYLDGAAAGFGGWARVGDVLRLWGAGTTAAARGRGVYRAVLDARLRRGLELGTTLALTHGRIHTSSPILQRSGFTRHGGQRQLRLTLT
jgi:hypothetical protein